jgi:hypothetical protein
LTLHLSLSLASDRKYAQAEITFQGSQMYNHLVSSLSGTTLKEQVAAGFKFAEVSLIGSGGDILDKIGQLREAGVTHVSGLAVSSQFCRGTERPDAAFRRSSYLTR